MVSPIGGQILVKVEACGVCYSDTYARGNGLGAGFPMVPGHEIIGRVALVGSDVKTWAVGQRVGSGWYGGSDGTCRNCHDGFFQMCENGSVNGVTKAGGYAEYVLINQEAAVIVPEDIDAAIAAPLLCAGVTVYNALKNANLKPGSTVAVQGLGGLGHLAISYARALGHRVVAISRGGNKEKDSFELGASRYLDANKHKDIGQALKDVGPASLAISTANQADAITPLLSGLGPGGKLTVLGVPQDPLPVNVFTLLVRGLSVGSWPSGNARDSEEAVAFAWLNQIETSVEEFKLEEAQEAFDSMLSGKARYRAVIVMK